MSVETQAASERRQEALLEGDLDSRIEMLLSEADTVGPHQRHQLRGILKHYAQALHPFRQCVRENMKRFGPGRTEKTCAVVKDITRGTTRWRGHPELDHPTAQAAAGAFDEPMSDEMWTLIERLGESCNITRVLVGLDEPPSREELKL